MAVSRYSVQSYDLVKTVLENSCSREQLFANGSGYLDTARATWILPRLYCYVSDGEEDYCCVVL